MARTMESSLGLCTEVRGTIMSVGSAPTAANRARQCTGAIRACSTVLIFTAVFGNTNVAAQDGRPTAPFAYFSTTSVESARLHNTPAAQASVRETHFEALLPFLPAARSTDYAWDASFMHRYRTLSVEALTPRANFNGDLHEIEVGLQARRITGKHARTILLRPGIAVSSNVLKNPDALTVHSLGGQFRWIEHAAQSARVNWLWGIGIDDRFGDYTAYPFAGLTWQPQGDTYLHLGYPDSFISHQLSSTVTMRVSVAPDGGQWRVHSKSMEDDADFHWENWRAGVALSWTHRSGWGAELQGGMLFEQHMRIPREEGGTLASDLDEAAFVSLAVHWRDQ